jgi:spore coat protein U-like protein
VRLKSTLSIATQGLLAIVLISVPAEAATASRSISVSVTVLASCAASASRANFGNYAGAEVSASSIVSVTCTQSIPYMVSLSSGVAPGVVASTPNIVGAPSPGNLLRSNNQRVFVVGRTMAADRAAQIGDGSAQALPAFKPTLAGPNMEGDVSSGAAVVVTVTY